MRLHTTLLTAFVALGGAGLSAQTTTAVEAPATASYEGELPPLIDRAILFDDPAVSGGQISPDGKWLTFMKPYQGERNVWVKAVDEPFDAARPLTALDRPVPGYFWTHDSENVLFVQDAGGDENYHVYAVDPAPGAETNDDGVPAPRALTSGEGVRAMIVDVPRSKPGTIYVGLNDRDPAFHDLYAVDVATGEKTLLYENKDEVSSYVFDNEGELRLATKSNDAGGTEFYRVDDGALSKIYDCSVDESCYPLGFAADGRRVHLVSNKGDADKTGLLLLDPQSGATELVERDPEGEVDLGRVITSDVTHELLATTYTGDKTRVYWRNDAWEADYAWLKSQVGEDTQIALGSSTADERKFVVYGSSDVDAGTAYVFDRDARTLEEFYTLRPELDADQLAEMRPIRYASSDGFEIPAYLTLPKGVKAEGLPLVVFVHGGPWLRDTWGFDAYAQFWANRGYAVLQPNFRASTGFGKAFLNAGNGEWGEKMQDDITAGVEYLVDEGIADADRVGTMGASYGGYATLAGLAFTPEVYTAGVSIVGPSNLVTLLNSIPAYWAAFRKQMYTRMADPDTEEGRAWLAERSPLNAATKIEDPLLVVQGANDPRVKQAESDQIVVALRDLGRPVEYLVAPDEGHGFRRPENNMAAVAAAEKFFAEHLGGRYQEDMPDDVAERLGEITVDPATVVLAQAPSEAEAKAARPTPTRDLAMGTRKYAVTMKVMGQEIAMDVTETIEETPDGYVVTQEMSSPMGAAKDVVTLGKEGLSPKRRTADMGPASIELTYPAGKVAGTMKAGGQELPLDVDLGGDIYADGAAEPAAIAALPLADGYTAVLRGFDAQTQQAQLKRLSVEGTETVDVPAGAIEAHRVVVKPADGSAGEQVYYVETAAPHRVVKATAVLPAMNGAIMEQVLLP